MPNDRDHSATDCNEVQLVLSSRVDDEAASADVERADAHLTECGDCRQWFDEERARTERLRGILQGGAPPAELGDAIVTAARAGRRESEWWRFRSGANPFLLAAAAVVVCSLIGLSVLDPVGEGRDDPRSTNTGAAVAASDLLPGGSSAGDPLDPEAEARRAISVDEIRVLPGADGPVGVWLNRAWVSYDLTPTSGGDGAGDGRSEVENSTGPPIRLELERVEPQFIRLESWPYH